METQHAELVSYLQSMIAPIVDNPDSVKVTHAVDDRGVILTVDVHPQDMGKIIGKSGETARSIRNLLRGYGFTHKMMISMKINEPAGSTRRPYEPREDRPRY